MLFMYFQNMLCKNRFTLTYILGFPRFTALDSHNVCLCYVNFSSSSVKLRECLSFVRPSYVIYLSYMLVLVLENGIWGSNLVCLEVGKTYLVHIRILDWRSRWRFLLVEKANMCRVCKGGDTVCMILAMCKKWYFCIQTPQRS